MKALRLATSLLAVPILALVLWRADPSELWRVLRHVDVGWLLLTVLLNLPIVAVASLRSLLILRRPGRPGLPRRLISSTVLGYVAGAVTPAGSGGLLGAERPRGG